MPRRRAVRLSVAFLTRGDDARGAAILRLLRPVADEIVVAVDAQGTAEAEARLGEVADRIFRYPYADPVERARPWLYRQCAGRWLLIIDDDEIPSRALLGALPRLVRAKDVTHYWLPRRWLYPSRDRFLAGLPWWPPFNEAFYLPEEAPDAQTRAVPPADRAALESALFAALPARGPRRAAPTRAPTRGEIDRHWPSPRLAATAYRAHLAFTDELAPLDAREVRTVPVQVRNLGNAIWPWGPEAKPEVRLTYRWWHGDEVAAEGLRTALPEDVRPGQSCLVPLALQAPPAAGRYRLVVDLVHEHVRWFGCDVSVEAVEVRARRRVAAVCSPLEPETRFAGDVVLLVRDPVRLRGRWAGEYVRSLEPYLLDGLPRSRIGAALVLCARGLGLVRAAFRVRRGREPAVAGETLRMLAGCDELLLRDTATQRRGRLAAAITTLCARLLGVTVVPGPHL